MPYRINEPVYQAVQWNGDNVAECEDFFNQWWPEDPPPPPWQDPPPPPPFQYNPDDNTLVIVRYGPVPVGHWMVNGGTWWDDGSWINAPEILSDDMFSQKYTLTT